MVTDRAVLRFLLRGARPATGLLVVSVIARIVGQAAGVALLAVPAGAIGALALDASPGWRVVVLWMIGLAVLKAACRYAEQVTGHVAAFTLLARMRVRLYDVLVPLAPAVTEQEGSGRLLEAATKDIDRVEVFYAHTIAPMVTAVVIPAGAVVVAVVAAGPVPAVLLAAGLAIGLVAHLLVGRGSSARTARHMADARARLAQEIADDVRGRDEIVTFGATEQRARRVDGLGAELGASLRSSGVGLGRRAAIQTAWQLATIIALLAVGGAPLDILLVLVAFVPGTAPALASVEAFARSLPAALASARRLLELERRTPSVDEPADPIGMEPVGRVELAGVVFAYPGRDRAVLDGVDLRIDPGEVVAIVGATGSGKSTVSRLLTRTWDPGSGAVRLDGQDVRTLALADLRRAVTVVDQRTALLGGTVRENLLLAAPEATDAELAEALDAACLAGDVRALPDGLDTLLGEDGARLSGGQAQRLALARGYLRRSPVMVLDEITSHQDPLTQRRILERLRERVGTAIVIAHRGAVLDHVDRVVVLEGGRVVEDGAPSALASRDGAFARLMG